jgi:hypothetical protein
MRLDTNESINIYVDRHLNAAASGRLNSHRWINTAKERSLLLSRGERGLRACIFMDGAGWVFRHIQGGAQGGFYLRLQQPRRSAGFKAKGDRKSFFYINHAHGASPREIEAKSGRLKYK